MSVADNLGRVVEILERQGIGGQELRDFADEVYGERDPDTGYREKSEKSDTKSDDKAPAKANA